MKQRLAPRSSLPVAFVGLLVWIGLAGVSHQTGGAFPLVSLLLSLASLVVVPLGLGLVTPEGEEEKTLLSIARRLQPMAASAMVGSLVFPVGSRPALLLAACWALVPVFCALVALQRLFERKSIGPWEEAVVDAALLYFPVGGVWLVAGRAGYGLLGFGDTLVHLTAAHFHYAGFAAPLLVGLSGRELRRSTSKLPTIWKIGAAVLTASIALVAAAIQSRSGTAEYVAATVLVTGMAFYGSSVLFHVRPVLSSTGAKVLVSMSAATLVLTMTLAMFYARGRMTGTSSVTIPFMVRWHGAFNAIGFALLGLLGYELSRRARVTEEPS